MRKIVLCGLSMMLLLVSAFAQETPKKDTIPLPKKTRQPPDSAFTNPIFEGPAEIDSINSSDSLKRGRRVHPVDRYREDSIPKSKQKIILNEIFTKHRNPAE